MFFVPIHNLPANVREKYLKSLTKTRQESKEDEKRNKEIKTLKEIISNPPKSLSIKNMMVYSYALRRLKELQE